jgi:hypothetical protein
LGGLRSRSGRCGREKSLAPAGSPAVQPVAGDYTCRAIPTSDIILEKIGKLIQISEFTFRFMWSFFFHSATYSYHLSLVDFSIIIQGKEYLQITELLDMSFSPTHFYFPGTKL